MIFLKLLPKKISSNKKTNIEQTENEQQQQQQQQEEEEEQEHVSIFIFILILIISSSWNPSFPCLLPLDP